jgi:HD-GYP domain-containing protein (c-di-GMP phosphodiesterase class II)
MLNSNITSFSAHHKLGLKLKSIPVVELFLARKLEHPIYIFKNGIFEPVIEQGPGPTKDQINALIENSHKEVYVFYSDLDQIKSNLEAALIRINRSLSIGDPLENGTKGMKLLALNLNKVYQNPHSDNALKFQFQNAQNLSKFFIENRKGLPHFFNEMVKEKLHFTMSQPMLSSILLLGFLKSTHLFNEREIENLFLTSYFKDIGFSIIPNTKYDLKILNIRDKELFSNHSKYSFDLLESRIPLSKNYLEIIKHHHFLNDKIKNIAAGEENSKQSDEMLMGLESTLVGVFDILVAMTNDRPYRKGISLYQSLEVIKRLMADDYPQEFKALIIFIKQFFKN